MFPGSSPCPSVPLFALSRALCPLLSQSMTPNSRCVYGLMCLHKREHKPNFMGKGRVPMENSVVYNIPQNLCFIFFSFTPSLSSSDLSKSLCIPSSVLVWNSLQRVRSATTHHLTAFMAACEFYMAWHPSCWLPGKKQNMRNVEPQSRPFAVYRVISRVLPINALLFNEGPIRSQIVNTCTRK